MDVIDETLFSNKTKRLILVFCVFVLFYLVSFLFDPYDSYWQNYFDRNIYDLVLEWGMNFLFSFMLAESSLRIHRNLNKSTPWIKSPTKRFLIETVSNIGAVCIFITLIIFADYLIYRDSVPSEVALSIKNILSILQWMVISLIISFIIVAVNTCSYFLNNWKNSGLQVMEQKLRLSELKQATVQAELNALQLQIDPHFIFNNLSVLSELIIEDPKLAYDYSENLSKVYRFLLVNSKKNMISLDDEIKFLKAYIFLIKNRVGEGVQFNLNIAHTSNTLFIPPLTLQLLVENALKHNRRTTNEPLYINIYHEGADKIIVENSLAPLQHQPQHSTGTGLSNIRGRFKLLSKSEPEILIENGFFKVIIYLIKYDQ